MLGITTETQQVAAYTRHSQTDLPYSLSYRCHRLSRYVRVCVRVLCCEGVICGRLLWGLCFPCLFASDRGRKALWRTVL